MKSTTQRALRRCVSTMSQFPARAGPTGAVRRRFGLSRQSAEINAANPQNTAPRAINVKVAADMSLLRRSGWKLNAWERRTDDEPVERNTIPLTASCQVGRLDFIEQQGGSEIPRPSAAPPGQSWPIVALESAQQERLLANAPLPTLVTLRDDACPR